MDPSVNNNYPIREASKFGRFKAVEALLKDKRVDPGDMENCALDDALRNTSLYIIDILMKDNRVNSKENYKGRHSM